MKATEMALATAKEMGPKAIERASKFSLAEGAERLVELYNFAIKVKADRVGTKD
jgi:hypothetical protein